MATQTRSSDIDLKWEEIAAARDEDGFRALVEPHMDRLLEAARYDLDYYIQQNIIQAADFTPEEVVGEGLIRAWDGRERKPRDMTVRGWLLGNLYRRLRGMVEAEHTYDEGKAISLDEEVQLHGSEAEAVEEEFWEWYQPDDTTTYDDLIPASDPTDLEVPLYATRESFDLDPDTRHALIMHDEFDMALTEVASVLNRNLNETAALLSEARGTFNERFGAQPGIEEVNHPAPPEGSDV